MADQFTEPSITELVERISRLENENSQLRAEIADVREGLRIAGMTSSRELELLNVLLYPVLDKVFPKFFETQSHMEKIVPSRATDPRMDRKLDEKSN